MTEILARNLASVRRRISQACERADRPVEDVNLLAVTKYVEAEVVDALAELGQLDVGENYVQGALKKIESCRHADLRWHLIGHLQSNKVRRVVGRFAAIQTVDSLRLLQRVGAVAAEQELRLPIFLQVNTTGESAKSGVAPEELPELARAAVAEPGVALRGLMTMAAVGSPEAARPYFRRLAELARRVGDDHGLPMRLSMGMSGDLEVAIEEGATDVRVGSALYQDLPEETAAQARG